MNSLALALLLGTIASSPFLAFGLANAAPSATRRQDTVIRRSLIFALCLGLLTLAGNWAGRVMTGLLEPGQQWLIDTLWYVVALKMIFVSFRRHPNYVGVD
ncbi:MAG TPA: hypothetical protein P5248_04495, partial [Bacteroidales bacterium]|nr:hypothetical protein [Bacteroidales bacterium]